MKNIKLLNRKKKDPEKFIFTGKHQETKTDAQLFKYNKSSFTESGEINLSNFKGFQADDYRYWLNIYGLNHPEQIAAFCKKLGIDNLVIQDILDVNQRPKFQVFEKYNFLTIKSIVPDDSEYITEQISFVYANNFLISFQERKGDHFEHLRFRIRENRGIIRERQSDLLLYTMLEAVLDNYFQTLETVENNIDALNISNIHIDQPPSVLEQIETYKKLVHKIKKAVYPIKEFASLHERDTSQFVEPKSLKYFLEIKDLCMTLLDNSDTITSTLESQINLFFSIQGHRMNQIMKTLTVVATIFIPLTFIAGIYGMNFDFMPELAWKYGYLGFWGIIFISVLLMLRYFRRKKWF